MYKSKTLMNASGPGIVRRYKDWLGRLPKDVREEARLVVLHDELELPLGALKLRKSGSPRGHNGLKSLASAAAGLGSGRPPIMRIGIGIGRPESRESEQVSRWVLRPLNEQERVWLGSEDIVRETMQLLNEI